MKAYWKYLIIGAAIVVSAWLLARAYTYKYHAQETIVVTGLGESEFSSDLIVWNGFITAEAQNQLNDRVTEICRAALNGEVPSSWQVEPDPE